MGQQNYVLVCSKITSFMPSEGEFSEKSGIFSKMKRGSLLGNEEIHLGGDSPIFEIICSNLEQRSIFSQKSTHSYVNIRIGLK